METDPAADLMDRMEGLKPMPPRKEEHDPAAINKLSTKLNGTLVSPRKVPSKGEFLLLVTFTANYDKFLLRESRNIDTLTIFSFLSCSSWFAFYISHTRLRPISVQVSSRCFPSPKSKWTYRYTLTFFRKSNGVCWGLNLRPNLYKARLYPLGYHRSVLRVDRSKSNKLSVCWGQTTDIVRNAH